MGAWTQIKNRIGRALLTEAAGVLIDDDEPFYRSIASQTELFNDLTPYSQTNQRRLARTNYFRDPVAGAMPDMIVARVLGDPPVFQANDDAVQEVIDAFAHDPDNDLERFLDVFATELLVFGELFLPIYLTKDNGDVRLGYIMPDQIEDVIWQRGDLKKPIAVLQKRLSKELNGPKRLWIVPHPDPEFDGHFPPHPVFADDAVPNVAQGDDGLPVSLPDDPSIRDLMQQGDIQIAGYMFYHRSHCLVTGRGRSVYERGNDFIKAFNDWFFGMFRNAVLQGSFVWDVLIKGASPTDLERKRKEAAYSRPPKPGSVLIHNENEVWTPLCPSLSDGADLTAYKTGALSVLGVSEGLPPHEMGATEGSNRSTAKESRSISVNRAKRFQRQISLMVMEWMRFQIDQKIYARQLPEDVDRKINVKLPEVDARDDADVATAVSQAATAVVLAVDNALMLKRDARSYLYSLIGQDVPPDEEFDAEEEERQQQQVAQQQDRLQTLMKPMGTNGTKPSPNGNGLSGQPDGMDAEPAGV